MPFSRKLAVAMEKQRLGSPFLSQKQLKHLLVGIEKLAKGWDQQVNMLNSGVGEDAIVNFANEERFKCGIESRGGLLTVDEIKLHDAKLFSILSNDIAVLREYENDASKKIAANLGDWLSRAEELGILIQNNEDDRFPYKDWAGFGVSQLVKTPEFLGQVLRLIQAVFEIHTELEDLVSHTEMNIAAIRRILKRHKLHVPSSMHSLPEFDRHEYLPTKITKGCGVVIRDIRDCLEDIYERAAIFQIDKSSTIDQQLVSRIGEALLWSII